jgi:uncharacterized membrane protein
MDWDNPLPWFLLVTLCALAARSITVDRRLRVRLDALADKLATLEQRLFGIDERLAPAGIQVPSAAPDTSAGREVTPEPETPEAHASQSRPQAPVPVDPAAAAAIAPISPPPLRDLAVRFEQRLVENWLVWLGAVTLALGGSFLVKLSIDYGLLIPPVRVALAVLLGIGLCVGAEWLSRREYPEKTGAFGASYVPQALAAAGAATIFASLYAAYQLYGFISGGLAFPLLAATAAATVAISLRHGPLVAALGLTGAYIVPALITSDAPHALPLFAYLICVTAAVLAVLRHRAWWWLAGPTLAGAFAWVMVWLGLQPEHPESLVVGIYILGQLALFAALRRGVPRIGFLAGISEVPMVRVMVRLAFALFTLSAFVLVHVDGFSNASLSASFAAAVFMLGFAYRDRRLDDVIATAAALLLATLATWNLPLQADHDLLLAMLRLPVEVGDFLTVCAIVAALLGGGGFLAQLRAPRPGRWAALSAASPVLVLVIAYWRLHPYGFDIGWSSVALLLAGLYVVAAASVARRRNGKIEIEIALSAYAVGVLSATILAATFALSAAWLSVALALHLPALGWIEGRVRIKVLRWLALGVAIVVLLRLAANPYLVDYPISAPIFNWLLYGYGVPALAFIVATRQFGSRADDVLVGVLEAGSILFATLLLTFELRHGLYGRLTAPFSNLGRDALNPLVWLALAVFLLWLSERRHRPVLRWGGSILFGLATTQVVLWQVLLANPLFTDEAVGRTIGVDVLTLAYAIPAVMYAVIAALRLGLTPLRPIARILAAALAFLWLTLEIRHIFRGENLMWGTSSDAEWYTYSAAWLAFAGIGLALGLVRRDEWLRRVSLAGIGLVVAKVFLSDMAELEGVLRALSFLGLGGVLIGAGYAYRRLRPLQDDPGEEAMPLVQPEG